MSKKFHARSILKPEKTREQEEWENLEDKKMDTKYKKPPTSVFDGINEDKFTKASEIAIMKDYSQGLREEDDDWCEERN